MVPAIKKVQAREKAVQEAADELFKDDPDYVPGEDPVERILSMMFAGWVAPEPAPVPDDTPQPQTVPDLFAPGA